jgi:hypothetical protein
MTRFQSQSVVYDQKENHPRWAWPNQMTPNRSQRFEASESPLCVGEMRDPARLAPTRSPSCSTSRVPRLLPGSGDRAEDMAASRCPPGASRPCSCWTATPRLTRSKLALPAPGLKAEEEGTLGFRQVSGPHVQWKSQCGGDMAQRRQWPG